MHEKKLRQQKKRRHARVRAKVAGTGKRPRLLVFRSNSHMYAQLINDEKGITLCAVSDFKIGKGKKKGVEAAKEVGKLIAKEAATKKIQQVVFDRNVFAYHGNVQAVAEGAKEEGLKF